MDEWFWNRVDRRDDLWSCWEWQGARNQDGYGTLWVDGSKQRAHRVAWRLAVGEIPEGLLVLHRCDNPPCVRPDHLFLGTPADNTADMMAKGRARYGIATDRSGWRAPRGERSGAAKLTEQAVRTIRTSGESQYVLARRYGVSQVAIHKVRARKTWTHVE